MIWRWSEDVLNEADIDRELAPLELRRADGAYSPVELAVLRGLGPSA
jgi:hypothetical protein